MYMDNLPKTRAYLISIAKRFENPDRIKARELKATESKEKKTPDENQNRTGEKPYTGSNDKPIYTKGDTTPDANWTPMGEETFLCKRCKKTHRRFECLEVECFICHKKGYTSTHCLEKRREEPNSGKSPSQS